MQLAVNGATGENVDNMPLGAHKTDKTGSVFTTVDNQW